jgi:serine/threonine-protein kinase
VVAQLLTAPPAAPSTLNAAVPVALEELILRLLAKDAEGRPGSASVVEESLRGMAEELRRSR